MIIGRNAFYLYHRSRDNFEIEYVDGNPYRHYDIHSIRSDLEKLLETVADTNNLDNANEIEFTIIENADNIRNTNVEQILGNRIKEKMSINAVLIRVVNALSKDNELHINEFGINYDGSSYILHNGELQKKPYSLLAYNVGQEKLIEYV